MSGPRLVAVVEIPAEIRNGHAVVSRALSLTGLKVDLQVISATSTPGSKKPGVVTVRAGTESLWEKLAALGADRVLAMGSAPATMLSRSHGVVKTSDIRGRLMVDAETDLPWMATGSAWGVMAWPDMFRDTVDDVAKLMDQASPIAEYRREDYDWRADRVPALAYESLVEFSGQWFDAISLDIETLGFDARTTFTNKHALNGLLQVGFSGIRDGKLTTRIVGGYDALADPGVEELIYHLTFSRSHVTVGHNSKFDLQWMLRYHGLDAVPAGAKIGDTMLLHHLLDERPVGKMAGSIHSLKTLARTVYDQPDYAWNHDRWAVKVKADTATESEWADFDWYHARDLIFTVQLWHEFRSWAENEPGITDCHDRLMGTGSAAIAAAELRGAPVDRGRVDEMARSLRSRQIELHQELAVVKVDPASPTQVNTILYGAWGVPNNLVRKKAGAVRDESSDRDHALAAIKWLDNEGEHDRADWLRTLLKWREAGKALKSYVEPLENRDRVHASFWLAGSVTGRLSSSEPNLQSTPAVDDGVPRHGDYNVRALFKALPGWVWVDVDYSQLELRVAALLSHDVNLSLAFEKGEDIHRLVASDMFGIAPEKVTKSQRFLAKSINFGILYGRTGWAIAMDEKVQDVLAAQGFPRLTEEMADRFVRDWKDAYPDVAAWLRVTETHALKKGYVQLRSGRRRRFLWNDGEKKRAGEIRRQATNSPIQGLASDICLSAFARLAEIFDQDEWDGGVELLFPVHDSINAHVREDMKERACETIKREMEDVPDWAGPITVPFTADVKVGPSWGEVK